MPTLEEVRRVSMDFQTTGAETTERKLRDVGRAHDAITVASEKTSRSLAGTERSLETLSRRYDTAYRGQKDLERATRDLDRALQAGLISQTRHGELLEMVRTRTLGAAASTGAFTGLLRSFGAGLAGGAIGAVAAQFATLDQSVLGVGDRLGELRDRAEQLGVSTDLLQGLTAAGIEAGMTQDKLTAALTKFTVEAGKAAAGEGDLIERLRAYDPAAASSIAYATTLEQRLGVLAQTFASTEDPAKRAALAVAAFGKSGADLGRFFAEAGGSLDQIIENGRAAGLVLERDLIDRGDEFGDRLAKAQAQISTALTPSLVSAAEVTANLAEDAARFARAMSEAKAPDWLVKLWNAPDTFLEAVSRDSNELQRRAFGTTLSDTIGGWMTPTAPTSITVRPAQGPTGPRVPLPPSRPSDLGLISDEAYARQRQEAERSARQLDREQAAFTRAQTSIVEHTRSLQDDARTYGMTAEEADRFRAAQDLTAAAQKAGIAASDGLSAKIGELADNYARAGAAAREARLGDDLAFERDQIGRSQLEQGVAYRLQSAGLPVDLNSAAAGAIRLNEQLALGKDLLGDFASSFTRDLRNGVGVLDALTNAASRLGDRLLDMALDQAISSLFSGITGMLGGSGLFGGGAVPVIGGAGPMAVPTFMARGGLLEGPGTGTSDSIPVRASRGEYIVNAAATSRHRSLLDTINSGLMDHLPRFARGGSIYAPTGEHGAEMILRLPQVQEAAA